MENRNSDKAFFEMRNAENTEILHLGMHPEYRGINLGTAAINFIKRDNKTIICK